MTRGFSCHFFKFKTPNSNCSRNVGLIMARAALVQMVSSADVADNLYQATELMKQARAMDADLVLLPENFAFMGFNEKDKIKIGEAYGDGPIQKTISHLAKQLGLWVIAGTIPLK